jgi:hypothetical protein
LQSSRAVSANRTRHRGQVREGGRACIHNRTTVKRTGASAGYVEVVHIEVVTPDQRKWHLLQCSKGVAAVARRRIDRVDIVRYAYEKIRILWRLFGHEGGDPVFHADPVVEFKGRGIRVSAPGSGPHRNADYRWPVLYEERGRRCAGNVPADHLDHCLLANRQTFAT